MEINKEFVKKLLKSSIHSFKIEDGCKKGDGVAGSLISIKVKPNPPEEKKEINLILKTLPPNTVPQFAYASKYKIFWVENAFYYAIIPLLEKINLRCLESNKILEELPFAKLIHCENNNLNDFLCLGDIRPEGYRMADKFIGFNLEEMTLVMKELAKFHALTYSLLKQEGETVLDQKVGIYSLDIYKMNFWIREDTKDSVTEMLWGCHCVAKDFLKQRNPEIVEKIEKVVKGPEDLRQFITKAAKGTDLKYFPCLIHGDFWVNNILLKYDENNSPISMKMVDFQLTRRGNIFEELQYCIATSTTPAFRKLHLPTVLNAYYDSFLDKIHDLRIPPPPNFTRGFFIESYYECIFPGFLFLGFAVPLQLATVPDFPAAEASEENENEHSEVPQPPPQKIYSEDDFDMKSMIDTIRFLFSCSPVAVKRVEEVAKEMIDLKYI